jgi:hypothetical protein
VVKEGRPGGRSEPEVTPNLAPDRRFPAVDFELLGIVRRVGQFRGRTNVGFVCAEFQVGAGGIDRVGEPFDGQAQPRKYVVVDDVVQKDGIGIECVPFQYDAIVECLLLADEIPSVQARSL